MTAATHRLVLIVPRGDDDGYGFDVRSLQELMAAVYLTIGSFERTLERLRIAAASPHWRNAWIFAAGRIFAVPQPKQHEALLDLVQDLDQSAHSRLGRVVPIAPRLALELTDDGMARAAPRWRDRLISQGLQFLNEPRDKDFAALVRILIRFADASDDNRSAVGNGLRIALGGTPIARHNATKAQELIPQLVEELSARRVTRGLTAVLATPMYRRPPAPISHWTELEEEIVTSPLNSAGTAQLLNGAIGALRSIASADRLAEARASLSEALRNEEAAKVLDFALPLITDAEPTIVRAIRDVVLPTIDRTPIGEALRAG